MLGHACSCAHAEVASTETLLHFQLACEQDGACILPRRQCLDMAGGIQLQRAAGILPVRGVCGKPRPRHLEMVDERILCAMNAGRDACVG